MKITIYGWSTKAATGTVDRGCLPRTPAAGNSWRYVSDRYSLSQIY